MQQHPHSQPEQRQSALSQHPQNGNRHFHSTRTAPAKGQSAPAQQKTAFHCGRKQHPHSTRKRAISTFTAPAQQKNSVSPRPKKKHPKQQSLICAVKVLIALLRVLCGCCESADWPFVGAVKMLFGAKICCFLLCACCLSLLFPAGRENCFYPLNLSY